MARKRRLPSFRQDNWEYPFLLGPGGGAAKRQLATPSAPLTPSEPIKKAPITDDRTTSPARQTLFGEGGRFSTIAGTIAHALDPKGVGGRLGAAAVGLAQQRATRGEAIRKERAKVPMKALREESLRLDIAGKKKKLLEEPKVDKPKLTKVVDNEGNVSWFRGSELISGSGKGKAAKEPAGKYHYTTDDAGSTSVYKDGELISGSGKGKVTKTEEVDKKTGKALESAAKLISRAQEVQTGVDKGSLLEDVNEDFILAANKILEPHGYEVVLGGAKKAVVKDWWPDEPAEQGIYVIRKKAGIKTPKAREGLGKSTDTERSNAQKAIDAGRNADEIKKLYKKRTGKVW